ncbi:hypothetical protein [Yinghuangia soli]|uniref:Uncharacterized protein n=1 Tax=Yinghuangia soli TaxID=2908204 RepID=A0AA41Q0M8_9ACTN|nr:hypothetical protein [Yinghuangia soli]MCF2529042.1 hypothetical protein [Yinghuangia soli]
MAAKTASKTGGKNKATAAVTGADTEPKVAGKSKPKSATKPAAKPAAKAKPEKSRAPGKAKQEPHGQLTPAVTPAATPALTPDPGHRSGAPPEVPIPPPVLLARGHLRRRGWTDSGILKFLGEPDAHAPNPVVWSAANMRLYDQARVAGIEATEVWQRWRAESEQRRELNRRRAEERSHARAEHLARLGMYAEVASHVANR